MKKLLALLFVCAGLTAMAGNPVLKDAKVKMSKAQVAQMTTMAKSQLKNQSKTQLNTQFVAPALAPQNVLPQQGLMKRAPRRATFDQVAGDRLAFMNLKGWTQEEVIENGDTTYPMTLYPNDPFYAGNSMRIYEDTYNGETDTLLSTLYYFDDIPMHFDLANNKVYLGDADGYNVTSEIVSIDTVTTGGGYFQQTNYVYHVYFVWLVNETNLTEDADEHMLEGQISEDGSMIYFPEGMVYYFAQYKRTLSGSTGNWTGSWTQEGGPWLSPFMEDVLIVAPNGTHEYTSDHDGASSNGVLMYQNETADTLVVWNLYDLAMPGNIMTLKSDYTMEFPAQYVYDFRDDYTNTAGDTIGGDFLNMYADIENDQYTNVEMGNTGVFNENQITWENCLLFNGNVVWDYYTGNKLTYNDGSTFAVPAPVSNYLRGDVDNDGQVKIGDVTALISALLSGNFDDSDNFNSENADCDLDGTYKIGDVTALITYLLSGEWQ